MASAGVYVVVVILGIIIVVTAIGCLLTILAIWTRPVLRKLVNLPLASLSCADILFAIFGPAFWIWAFLQPQWQPPGALCSFQGYITPTLWGVSICHMSCIALQRYFKVCTYSTLLKSKCVLIIMLLVTWLVPIVSFVPLYAAEEVKVDPKLKRCSTGGSTNMVAKIIPLITVFIIPYIVSFTCYVLIYKQVKKSRERVQANAPNLSNRLAVQFSRGEAGDMTGTSPDMTESVRVTGLKNSHGGVWVGDKNSSSSDEDQKENEPGKSTVSKQADVKHQQQQQRVGQGHRSQNNAAERQITKMALTLFVVYTVCCMPMTIMVMISSVVPSEAFTVGQVLMGLNGALNPIVYGLMNKNIRQGYKHFWDSILNFIT